ncbi:tryptophanyl-tRNA synthetase [Suhomyces tanzawaensis NRRL Y-17324]|uniref:Tryptophan--tRNA ligase, mitochondrial n=1 Tax=Suhomyces tanzawaensis NRRL Y-17324 TaxID=984487 RepID=A0A1E4SGJ3_9ASCO|nr:tryptophanyl-tRNA synthetase [Suhomyces tanzawaensis NRRL Y-17324]ODV78639.1 tryptophanyl-tRNA synthetase [Suhomyces tanzawaensis NRRL Y-17324]
MRSVALRVSTRRLVSSSTRANASVQSSLSIEKFPPKSTIFSLIQPTGKIHLGNYLGALRGWADLLKVDSPQSKFIFGVADLHALTMPTEPLQLKQHRYEAMASLIAAGLDPERCIVFHQSTVPEHTELNWYLVCLAGMGQLNRMTQWKLKAHQALTSSIFEEAVLEKTRAGVLLYPVLQTADILIYKSTHVPVGDDQTQHLELCRTVANTFNHTYKTKFFPLPKTLLTPASKVLALRNPSKKMSKSDADQNSSIYLTESPDTIAKKVRKATTDSIQGPLYYDPETRPGVSNLINIVAGINRASVEDTVRDLAWVKDHKQLKDHVTEVVVEEFREKRHMFDHLMGDLGYLDSVSKQGTERAREIALKNIKEVRALMGLN